jgi:hypothetical protein
MGQGKEQGLGACSDAASRATGYRPYRIGQHVKFNDEQEEEEPGQRKIARLIKHTVLSAHRSKLDTIKK